VERFNIMMEKRAQKRSSSPVIRKTSSKSKCPKKERSEKLSTLSSKFNKDSKFLWEMRKVSLETETNEAQNPSYDDSFHAFFLEDLQSDDPAIHLGQQVTLVVNFCLDPSLSLQDPSRCLKSIFDSPFKRRAALNLAARMAKYKWRKSSWSTMVELVGHEAALWLTFVIATSACFLQKSAKVKFDWKKFKEHLAKHVKDSLEKFCSERNVLKWKTDWKDMTTRSSKYDSIALRRCFEESFVRFEQAYFTWRGRQDVVCRDLIVPSGEDIDDQKWFTQLFPGHQKKATRHDKSDKDTYPSKTSHGHSSSNRRPESAETVAASSTGNEGQEEETIQAQGADDSDAARGEKTAFENGGDDASMEEPGGSGQPGVPTNDDVPCSEDDCFNQALYVCQTCQKAFYCSRECQIKHWEEHKECCMRVAAEVGKNLRS